MANRKAWKPGQRPTPTTKRPARSGLIDKGDAECPIPGCGKRFANGKITGWQQHLNGHEHALDWRPDLTTCTREGRQARIVAFNAQYTGWVSQWAKTPSVAVRALAGEPLASEEAKAFRVVLASPERRPCGVCGAMLVFPDGFSISACDERRALTMIAGREPCRLCGS